MVCTSDPATLSDAQLADAGFARALAPGTSGIHIVIVGCGFAGLACAIESVRKGHTAVILEKDDSVRTQGASPSNRTPRRGAHLPLAHVQAM
jgi:NADPH-dependent 2,4-dienoyl-CoA reductase/sulfur reductase-like enzyme